MPWECSAEHRVWEIEKAWDRHVSLIRCRRWGRFVGCVCREDCLQCGAPLPVREGICGFCGSGAEQDCACPPPPPDWLDELAMPSLLQLMHASIRQWELVRTRFFDILGAHPVQMAEEHCARWLRLLWHYCQRVDRSLPNWPSTSMSSVTLSQCSHIFAQVPWRASCMNAQRLCCRG
jgi:hypothetical protein